ncbi:MAG TPA: FlgO family outer membrane protein [Thermoanaerobaculia bacterium]|nr:FlgO family outer membrane protein [Thermoanaerobaculia bacterium]
MAALGFLGFFLVLWAESRDFAYVVSLERVADQLLSQASGREMEVAVVPFSDFSGNTPQLGLFISDALTGALARRGSSIHVLDRSNLKAILGEQRFALGGLVDPRTMQRIGMLASADALIVGRLDLARERLVLNVSLVDVETARTIASSVATMIATERMQELWERPLTAVDADLQRGEISRLQHQGAARPHQEAFDSLLVAFVVRNWPWIWTVLLVPVCTWLIARARRRWSKSQTAAPEEKAL